MKRMRVKIREAGEDPNEVLDQTIIETFNPRNPRSKIHKKSLRQVFNTLARHPDGHNHTVRRLPRGIFPETLSYVRPFIIARMPGLYADRIGGWPATTHRFLIDENMPKSLNIHLWRDFGRATHIEYEGLKSEKDTEVWRWAKANKIAAIITKDKRMNDHSQDLGLIAVKHAHDLLKKRKHIQYPILMPHMPLLIQISPKTKKSAYTLMKQHKDEIMKHLENRTHPYIVLGEKNVITGPSYSDIAKYDWITIKTMTHDISLQIKGKTRKNTGSSASPS